ncbi:MAG: M20/M25/M40 family metallo-hydrolase [Campylobacterota bacterium]|nr:M20/M25/M40 family metallo-hydrolase [Campylobacterota bacterium]
MRIIELFKEITKVPRCSGTHEPFIEYIKEFSYKTGYICKIDDANNILCFKDDKKANIALQSHYDIVCLKDNTIPEIIEIDGYLKAKNSTLGADNGIGCAYMLALMEEGANAEYLFTCDEEIGLIGANNITHNLNSSFMLNLDSEAEGEICIGCAGGIDIFGINNSSKYISNDQNKELYEIEIKDLDGGHSGVDIDKNIPNALKLIVKTIKESDADLLDLNGGERINSIPKYAKAIIASNNTPKSSHKNMSIKKIEKETEHYKKIDSGIVDFLYTFANGVRGYDKELGVVLSSINLAIVENSINGIKISLSARSMDNDELKIVKDETIRLLEVFNFCVEIDGKYPAWKPSSSQFNRDVLKIYQEMIPNATLNAIHAGLECAIFKDKYPDIQVCSIGPNIYFPHSFREECDISSALKLYDITKNIVKSYE